MAKRGNPNHKGAGTPEGGQFTGAGQGISFRTNPMENDIRSYLDNRVVGSKDPIYKNERIKNINKALYDGGYLNKRSFTLNGFENSDDAEDFIRTITNEHATSEAWLEHKDMVNNYVGVAKSYFSQGDFDLVIDGKRSKDGSARKATELSDEFGWDKKQIQKILMESIDADCFVNSGANDSAYAANQGTVVMVFAPRISVQKEVLDMDTKTRTVKSEQLDLYVKMVLNPHPDRARKQTEMQVLSIREATGKTCLYTKERRLSREQWLKEGEK